MAEKTTPLNMSAVDLGVLIKTMAEHSSEIKNIKDHYVSKDEIIKEMRAELTAIKSQQDTTDEKLKHFERRLTELAKSVVNFRYWLGGTVLTSLITGLVIYFNQTNAFEAEIRDQVQIISKKVDSRYDRLETKIDKSNTKIENNFKLMVRMMKDGP